MNTDDINPKTLVGSTKVPLHYVPPAAIHHMALGFSDGAKKYGPYNWREKAVPMMTYIGAALRHLHALLDGEDVAADSGVHHAAHAADCCAIILDALEVGKLVDDRPSRGAAGRLQAQYAGAASAMKAPFVPVVVADDFFVNTNDILHPIPYRPPCRMQMGTVTFD